MLLLSRVAIHRALNCLIYEGTVETKKSDKFRSGSEYRWKMK